MRRWISSRKKTSRGSSEGRMAGGADEVGEALGANAGVETNVFVKGLAGDDAVRPGDGISHSDTETQSMNELTGGAARGGMIQENWREGGGAGGRERAGWRSREKNTR